MECSLSLSLFLSQRAHLQHHQFSSLINEICKRNLPRPAYLPHHLLIHRPSTSFHLLFYLSPLLYLSISLYFLQYLPIYLPICLPTYPFPADLSIKLISFLLTYLFILSYVPITFYYLRCLPIYPPTYLPPYQRQLATYVPI